MGEIGDNLTHALILINELKETSVKKVSPLYRTLPVGGPKNEDGTPAQPDFINGAIEIETGLTPPELMAALLKIETKLGRVRLSEDGPRTLDLDVILWGDTISEETSIILPHPRMFERGFVLTPLADIAPLALHPLLKKSMRQLLDEWVNREDIQENIKIANIKITLPNIKITLPKKK
jgi:2-amino-4-hydroxy-6-hydroxymethyldihydropteridine diphosphokinase